MCTIPPQCPDLASCSALSSRREPAPQLQKAKLNNVGFLFERTGACKVGCASARAASPPRAVFSLFSSEDIFFFSRDDQNGYGYDSDNPHSRTDQESSYILLDEACECYGQAQLAQEANTGSLVAATRSIARQKYYQLY